MYVCICKKLSDSQIREAVFDGRVKGVRDLRTCFGACDQCGKCLRDAREVIREATPEQVLRRGPTALAA